ncbi:cytochrome c [Massilia sp. METH4]|uniref:c-type cytochrome n=1 Tax=Massilia sp. METH4 TaxID=3123041 RepID=UPI0030D05C76
MVNLSTCRAVAIACLLTAVGPGQAQQVNGAQLYQSSCAMCHQSEGQGAPSLAPPLKGPMMARLVKARAYVPGVLLAGMHGPLITDDGPFNGVMPTQNRLSDDEIAAVSSHLAQDFNGLKEQAAVTAAEVAALRAKLVKVAELRTLRKQTLGQ